MQIHVAVAIGQTACALRGIKVNGDRLAGGWENGVCPDYLSYALELENKNEQEEESRVAFHQMFLLPGRKIPEVQR